MNTATLSALAAALGVVLYLFTRPAQAMARDTMPEAGGAITTDTPEADALAADESFGLWAVYTWAADRFGDPQRLSAEGRALLMQREGFAAVPYPDFKGNSIGFGHLIRPGENLERVTRQEGETLLAADVAWAEAAVRAAVSVTLSQTQFDALVSFAFNVGEGAFKSSTMVRRINAGDLLAASEFQRWVYAGGNVLPALVARRASEKSQYEA